jgi:hypothetical protein
MTVTEAASQRIVKITFTTQRMTNSTELKRLLRAVESTYYFCLFTQEEYAGRPEVWRTWAKLGFATGLQEAPPGAAEADRVRISTFSNQKELTFTAAAGSQRAAEHWLEVLREITARRAEVSSLAAADRAASLAGAAVIKERLIDPVDAAVAAIPPDERAVVLGARGQALASLSYPIISSCLVTEHAGSQVG